MTYERSNELLQVFRIPDTKLGGPKTRQQEIAVDATMGDVDEDEDDDKSLEDDVGYEVDNEMGNDTTIDENDGGEVNEGENGDGDSEEDDNDEN